ncbi:MAG: PEP-CTERM sorting domain-containing protein [Planctomycetota bacterium]
MVATDALNPFVGDGHLNVHFELKDDMGATNLRTDASGIDIAPRLNSADLTTDYQLISHEYSLTAADLTAGTGLLEVVAVVSTDINGGVGGGGDSSAGLIYVDDFHFEVLDANCFVTVVPEPSTGLLMAVALMGLGFLRRR